MKKLILLSLVFGLVLGLGASLPALAQEVEDPEKVTGMTIKARKVHKVRFAWDPADDAAKYIMRVTTPKGKLVKKKKTDKTATTVKKLKASKKYDFKVKAKKNTGKFTEYSNTRQVKTKKGKLYLYNGEKTGVVKWDSKIDAEKGFKLVWSKNSEPTYPTRKKDKYAYYSDPNTDKGTTCAFNGTGKYYVRVCEYLGGKCGKYSNQVSVELGENELCESSKPKPTPESKVNSISLSDSGYGNVRWGVNGYSANGFKVVWSRNSNPTYPTRSGDKYKYLSSPGATSAELYAFDGVGTYYVRVCEYLGGACGTYSNQVQVYLD